MQQHCSKSSMREIVGFYAFRETVNTDPATTTPDTPGSSTTHDTVVFISLPPPPHNFMHRRQKSDCWAVNTLALTRSLSSFVLSFHLVSFSSKTSMLNPLSPCGYLPSHPVPALCTATSPRPLFTAGL